MSNSIVFLLFFFNTCWGKKKKSEQMAGQTVTMQVVHDRLCACAVLVGIWNRKSKDAVFQMLFFCIGTAKCRRHALVVYFVALSRGSVAPIATNNCSQAPTHRQV